MSDHFVSEASTTYTSTTQEMNIHALSGIRNREPRNRPASDTRLRSHGHQDWHCMYLFSLILLVNRKKYGSLTL
jgi:hypothetical protein